MKLRLPLLFVVLLAGSAAIAHAATPVRRLALIVGANRGADGRVPLRYAVADAERFSALVTKMGGVSGSDRTLLKDPDRAGFLNALATVAQTAAASRAQAGRVEVLMYFSGHADDKGLMLGRETIAYPELRTAMNAMNVDVGITILDACASGAITRLKGGKTQAAFLVDPANVVQGYAFLTSSSETEAAQESDRLGGSFFTGALLTGLRGAADSSGDGRVTLNEAYQFAFHETIAQTSTTEAGAQHPAYDIKMAGTGDVVMTDLRKTSSRLVLGESYDGRFLVLNTRRALIAELYKPKGRAVELGLEPGQYDVFYEHEKVLSTANVHMADGQRTELLPAALRVTTRRAAQRRGIDDVPTRSRDLLDGRLRLELGTRSEFDFSAAYFIKPTMALTVNYAQGFDRLIANSTSLPLEYGYRRFTTVLAGYRFYPPTRSRLRPFVGVEGGFFNAHGKEDNLILQDGQLVRSGGASTSSWKGATATLRVGADLYLGRNLFVDVSGSHGLGPGHFSAGIGWTFGGRH